MVSLQSAQARGRQPGTIGEHIVDVLEWQTVGEATEAAEVSGRNRTLQFSVERILDVPVPRDEVQQ